MSTIVVCRGVDYESATASTVEVGESRQLEGLLLLGVGLIAVSVANVACEHAYKSTSLRASLQEQNCVLYSLGVLMNGIALLCVEDPARDAAEDASMLGFLHDYTGYTVALILVDSTSGYLVGALLRHIDAIAAIFADLASMLITTIVSAVFFDLHANPLFCLGFGISCLSFWVYYGAEHDKLGSEEMEARAVHSGEKQQLLQETFENGCSSGSDDCSNSSEGRSCDEEFCSLEAAHLASEKQHVVATNASLLQTLTRKASNGTGAGTPNAFLERP